MLVGTLTVKLRIVSSCRVSIRYFHVCFWECFIGRLPGIFVSTKTAETCVLRHRLGWFSSENRDDRKHRSEGLQSHPCV